jgi:hypothetical protein
MRWVYLLIVLVIAAFTLGCVDKKQAGTTTETSTGAPVQTSVLPGESKVTPAESPEMSQIPAPGEDVFGTYGDLAAMDNISGDMDMQIALSTEI